RGKDPPSLVHPSRYRRPKDRSGSEDVLAPLTPDGDRTGSTNRIGSLKRRLYLWKGSVSLLPHRNGEGAGWRDDGTVSERPRCSGRAGRRGGSATGPAGLANS